MKKASFVLSGLFIVLVLVSCETARSTVKTPVPATPSVTVDSAIVPALVPAVSDAPPEASPVQSEQPSTEMIESLKSFWYDFRMASCHYEFESLKKLTQFPLKTRGLSGSDPDIYFNENELDGMFYLFLNKNIDLIGDSVDLNPSMIHDNFIKTLNMIFSYTDGAWKLTSLTLDKNIYDRLAEPSPTERDGKTPLRPSELAYFSEYLCQYTNNGFLLSDYTEPTQINLNRLFYNGSGIASGKFDLSQQELSDYLMTIHAKDTHTDLIKLTVTQIRDLLKDKMGISYDDVAKKLGWLYIEKYDAYYKEVGDTNYCFTYCAEGYKTSDGKYSIHCKNPFNEPHDAIETIVTLQKVDNNKYWFVSNQIHKP